MVGPPASVVLVGELSDHGGSRRPLPVVNSCHFIGNLTRDPEVRYTGDGQPVVTFTLAVNRPYVNADGTREVDYIDFVAFGQPAEFAERFLTRGRCVYASGRLQIRRYQGRDGIWRRAPEVRVQVLQAIGPRRTEDDGQPAAAADAAQPDLGLEDTTSTTEDPFAE